MESPCINICILDEERGLCRGCLRTLDEIGDWGRYSVVQRAHIMASMALRREEHQSSQQDHPEGGIYDL